MDMPLGRQGSQIAIPEERIVAKPRQDFTYRRIIGQRTKNASFRQSLFIGAILKDCTFESVIFDRCDFAGVKIVNCAFVNCRFAPDEFRSCAISESVFQNCNFRGSQWLRIEARNVRFLCCDFRETSVRESRFAHCEFDEWRLKRSSITLNQFTKCKFTQVDFGDCTALFLLFDFCNLKKSRINAESIGYTFGITRSDLEELDFLYLGRKQPRPVGDIAVRLAETYRARNWHVGACILELNFRARPPLASIRDLTTALHATLRSGIPVDWDEIKFLIKVLESLDAEQRLPLLGAWLIVRVLQDCLSQSPGATTAPGAEITLASVDQLLMSILDRIGADLDLGTQDSELLVLDLELLERPEIPLGQLIPPTVSRLFNGKGLSLIDARPGSWFEKWEAGLATLSAVRITLVAVNGVMSQITKAIENAKRLTGTAQQRPKKRTTQKRRKKIEVRRDRGQSVMPSTIATQIDIIRVRSNTLSPERLARLERVLSSLLELSDAEIDAFDGYAAERLRAVTVRSARRNSAKTGGRVHRPGV